MAVAVNPPESHTATAPPIAPTTWLVLWSLLAIALHLSDWLSGVRDVTIGSAVEAGVAKTESRMTGEFDEDAIRKAIRLQYDTFVFWRALFAIGDLVAVPTMLITRSIAIAAAIAAAAAMTGRTPRFAIVWGWSSLAQGCWLLGPLMVWGARQLGVDDFETTARIFLPSGPVLGAVWVFAGNVDFFGLCGWSLLAIACVARGWAHFTTGWFLLMTVALMDYATVSSIELLVQAAMRGTVLP